MRIALCKSVDEAQVLREMGLLLFRWNRDSNNWEPDWGLAPKCEPEAEQLVAGGRYGYYTTDEETSDA